MASKGAKETLVSKLGFRSNNSGSKAEAELEKVRKENAHLRKKIDEQAKRHIKSPDSDKGKLLERILSLETLRERNNQQLLVKEQELESLRQQLSAKGGEVVASLQAQLEQRRRDAEQRDGVFQSLSQETENLKNKLATVSARCQSLEKQATVELVQMQDQLKDALEKNQQWLVYDQQREVFVQSVVARTMELEQQLEQAKQQQESKAEPSSEVVHEERKVSSERTDRVRADLEKVEKRLDEEKKRSADLLQQVRLLYSTTLKTFFSFPPKIQLSAKDSENEKLDRQSMQEQLQKVQKELRKARDQIAKLESAKQLSARFSEPSSYNNLEFERLTINSHGSTSPSKVIGLLDESFLECPKCQAPYATSRHRELLAHIDYCFA
uniref:Centrosomal protein 55 like n=1 Tax=Xiphophorus couchianus TaxID=32473 RepID=A0A3B5LCD4_9TELE